MRGNDAIAELRRKEGIIQGLHYTYSKSFNEINKPRPASVKRDKNAVFRFFRDCEVTRSDSLASTMQLLAEQIAVGVGAIGKSRFFPK